MDDIPCQTIDHELVRIAIEHSERFAISYWDAAILAAAEALGTDTVYSESFKSRAMVWTRASRESLP